MKFRTEFNVDKFPFSILHTKQILFLGSCFAEEIGKAFTENGFGVLINPFGVIFNPISIANILSKSLENENGFSPDILQFGNRFYSLQHHGSFASNNRNDLVEKISLQHKLLNAALTQSEYLFITFGTANVYRWKETGAIVANCHKLPQHFFERTRLTVADTVAEWRRLIASLKRANSRLKIIFTVSPVRYLNFGMHEHQLSKAVLLLAIDELVQSMSDVYYFPAYELVIDDLRDYRFMKEDLIHPNKQAVSYIWEKLCNACFNHHTLQLCKRANDFFKMKSHSVMNLETKAAANFTQQIEAERLALQSLLPLAKLD